MSGLSQEGGNPYEESERDDDSSSSASGSRIYSESERDSEGADESGSEKEERNHFSGSESSSEEESDSEDSIAISGSDTDEKTPSKLKSTAHNYLKHITISQDHSEGSGFESRNLLVLKEGGPGAVGSHNASQTPPQKEAVDGKPKSRVVQRREKKARGQAMDSLEQPPGRFQQHPPPSDFRGPPPSNNIYHNGMIPLPPPPPPPPQSHDFNPPTRSKSPSKRRNHRLREKSVRHTLNPPAYPSGLPPPISLSVGPAFPSLPSAAYTPQSFVNQSPQIPSAISQAFLDQTRNPSSSAKVTSTIPRESVTNLESLQDYIAGLQLKAKALEELERSREPSNYQVLYRLLFRPPEDQDPNAPPQPPQPAQVFFDAPQWAPAQTKDGGPKASKQLRSSLPLYNVPSYMSKHPEISFLVYRDFLQTDIEDGNDLPPIIHEQEFLSAYSIDLIAAITSLLKSRAEYSSFLPAFVRTHQVAAPYLFIYHSRSNIDNFVKSLSDPCQRQMSLFLDYVFQVYGDEYKTADSLLARSRISLPYVKYLFKPGDLLVAGIKSDMRAFISKSWPLVSRIKEVYRQGAVDTYEVVDNGKGRSKRNYKKIQSWPIDLWTWRFNGTFKTLHMCIHIQIGVDDLEEKDIADLNLRPLSHLGETQAQYLRDRGQTFWRCRFRRFISYSEEASRYFEKPVDERYMIDLATYRELHTSSNTDGPSPDDLSSDLMESDTLPSGNFIYLLPPSIKGYNLQRKKWVDLQVDRISDVTWNKEAFESLVLDSKTKDLIEALISNQLAAEKSTDLIGGKGNGLILLLHGGPGTGKTLTAESVAEIAEKPLYRVTCGDIGTEPEDVEKYLESVLHLGKTWGCVVLLDEADVFLEQRGLEDLKRNALVSVFLRVLEYYDGILILTSNRVGTFDEAFKSRIQLALHYANLTKYQRIEIWKNFISRLRTLGEQNIDFHDLKDHVEQLAENEMNGRQIRNAITTARQYAQWKKTILTYDHLKDIIEISGRFDKYLDKLNDGYSQDQIAQNDGLRFAGRA
ncbi:hypothetical protein HYFRA_00001689 [Hymenoscyphus fraxineus]|uniref:AAA+ ATPase domain-containing protein n=1 Tax=Hymenoscyphus fraxineus TaxID=746836 RepID=A0A9N9PZJ4_9HELO|nr:hypothetical protein HYFRA_00001689 [Hymenoscyphus fraxineus]